MLRRVLIACCAISCLAAGPLWAAGKFLFPDELIPRFNVPHMAKPPTIDGKINPDEWREAARVMGMVGTFSLGYRDRPVSFWVGWDEQHLYIAARSDVLPGHRLYRSRRERHTTNVVFDDAYEFGIFMHDRNRLPGEHSNYLKFILNSLGSGEYMKLYPSIGQNMYNWQPDSQVASSVHEADGQQWFDLEVAMDLQALQMPVPNKAGDKVDMMLAADLKNPGWQWLDFPSATGHLEHYGFPRETLTMDEPYVQIERLAGLHDEKLDLKTVIYNPGSKPVTVNALATIQYNPEAGTNEPARAVVDEKKSLTVPARGSVRFDVDKSFPGLGYEAKGRGAKPSSRYHFEVKRADAQDAIPIYGYTCDFAGTNKDYLVAQPRTTVFEYEMQYNPVNNRMLIAGDTLDAQVPAGSKIAALTYAIDKDGATIKEGRITQFVNLKYEDLVELPALAGGKYRVTLAFVDAAGKPLVSRSDITFEKKDEAREFAAWWNNRIGDTEKVLKPFEPLKVTSGKSSSARHPERSPDPRKRVGTESKDLPSNAPRQDGDPSTALGMTEGKQDMTGEEASTFVSCTRRVYELDGLGLPRQITANNGPVLTGPARIVVTVGGREHVVPADGQITFTSRKDWRVEFAGGPSEIAGLRFSTKGWMEQDGLVNLELTYAPVGGEAKADGPKTQGAMIDDLRVEWPVDDSLGSWMSCIGGVGGNYSPRTIDKVPEGKGQVWDTLSGIGKAGSTMLAGNWENNLWVGNEVRGLLWCGDSDQGWVPNDKTPAHSLFRDGKAVVIRNHIIRLPKGEKPFPLDAPRTAHLQYNASPFRHLAKGWRLTQVSAANGFAAPDYKTNEKTKQEYFSIISMPSTDTNEWAEYYAKYKTKAEARAKQGWYNIAPRLTTFLCNQIALRGYMDKTVEPGVYGYFRSDWVPGGESLNKSYRDYAMYLMNRHIREGGVTHYYFDISFSRDAADLVAGFGYRLPDGRVQPGSMDGTLREWYKRVWALMQETDLYPGAVSGHATHSICLRALPWADAILDSEYPMKDPITVYTKDSMIAMSCPHSFGVKIDHLGFMNPNWAALHDAGMGGSGGVFNDPEFRHFGIAASDVQFVPYWRNETVVKKVAPGLLASVWKRPGKALVEVMNYGPDAEGKEQTRSAKLTLDLRALGVPPRAKATEGNPAGVKADQVRIREAILNGGRITAKCAVFAWYDQLPDTKRWANDEEPKVRPLAAPTLNPATGAVEGAEVFYHDSRYLLITWDDKPADPAALTADVGETNLVPAVEWGIGRAEAVADGVQVQDGGATVKAWKQPGTAMLLVRNPGDKAANATLQTDLVKLGVKVPKLWTAYTQCLGGELNAETGALTVKQVPPGGAKAVFIDTFAE